MNFTIQTYVDGTIWIYEEDPHTNEKTTVIDTRIRAANNQILARMINGSIDLHVADNESAKSRIIQHLRNLANTVENTM